METIQIIAIIFFIFCCFAAWKIGKLEEEIEEDSTMTKRWLQKEDNLNLFNQFVEYVGIDFETGLIKSPDLRTKGTLTKLNSASDIDRLGFEDRIVVEGTVEHIIKSIDEKGRQKLELDMSEAFKEAANIRRERGFS